MTPGSVIASASADPPEAGGREQRERADGVGARGDRGGDRAAERVADERAVLDLERVEAALTTSSA